MESAVPRSPHHVQAATNRVLQHDLEAEPSARLIQHASELNVQLRRDLITCVLMPASIALPPEATGPT